MFGERFMYKADDQRNDINFLRKCGAILKDIKKKCLKMDFQI